MRSAALPVFLSPVFLLPVFLLIVAGCPGAGDGMPDAGEPPFEGTLLDGGYTDCGSVTCQPGQTCRDEGLCYLGCEVSAECGPGEICDYDPGLGGVCVAAERSECGDGLCALGEHVGNCPVDCPGTVCDAETQGEIACGEENCGPGTYCANPAEGLCYSGCLSAVNCGCGRRCDASPGQPGQCTVPIEPDLPECGDGVCEEPEAPQTCIDDCSWETWCTMLCIDMDDNGCWRVGGAGLLCADRCLASTEEQQESFAFCVALAGGPEGCGTSCVDELEELVSERP